jgi:hypothetical protein
VQAPSWRPSASLPVQAPAPRALVPPPVQAPPRRAASRSAQQPAPRAPVSRWWQAVSLPVRAAWWVAVSPWQSLVAGAWRASAKSPRVGAASQAHRRSSRARSRQRPREV